MRSHGLVSSASQVWFVSCDHLPEHHTETVDITAGSVARPWEGGREGGERGQRGRERVRERETEGREGSRREGGSER